MIMILSTLLQIESASGGYEKAAIVLLCVTLAAVFGIRQAWKDKGTTIIGSFHGRYVKKAVNPLDKLREEYYVYEGRQLKFPTEQYVAVLEKRLPFYSALSAQEQQRFVNRTRAFVASKTFLIKSDETFVEMPILVSATAVQLTFGLENYLLPHYQYVRIFKEEYIPGGSLKVLLGHVYGNTITLSWNNFLEGHAQASDGVNLGLHEMAHALYYQLVEADTDRCRQFTRQFNKVLEESQEIRDNQLFKPSRILKSNAYRNLQECWAESVELFFEQPSALKEFHPDLYAEVSVLLGQDMLARESNPSWS